MAITNVHAILEFDGVPSHTPSVGQATLGRLQDSFTFEAYIGGSWKEYNLAFPTTFTGAIISDNASLGTALQELETAIEAVTQDGNSYFIARGDAIEDVEPTNVEVPSPINGDTANIYLTSGIVEFWVYSTSWTKAFDGDISTPAFSTVANTLTIDLTLNTGELTADVRLATPNAGITLSSEAGGLQATLSPPPSYVSLAAATSALGSGKQFTYTTDNIQGAIPHTVAWTV